MTIHRVSHRVLSYTVSMATDYLHSVHVAILPTALQQNFVHKQGGRNSTRRILMSLHFVIRAILVARACCVLMRRDLCCTRPQ